jgi:hypothetical protein
MGCGVAILLGEVFAFVHTTPLVPILIGCGSLAAILLQLDRFNQSQSHVPVRTTPLMADDNPFV